MKRITNLYSKITSLDTIMNMYDNIVRKNTKNKNKIQRFENFYCCNIAYIKESLASCKYVVGKYNIFLVHEPKVRIIMSQEIVDKVVNHLVAKYFLVDVFDKCMLDRNCATRIGKGTHYALKLFKNDYNYFINKNKKFYILKLDISKYFYNIDHDITKELVRKKIKDKKVLKIIDSIIDSTDETYVNKKIYELKQSEIKRIIKSNLKENEKEIKIREVNDLPYYEYGKGCCIGNMVSQIIATFYLSDLDHYIYYDLKCKNYARYMDDMYIMHEDKNYLKECLKKVNVFIKKYKLELNKKTKIYSSNENIEFLGFMFNSKNKNICMRLTNKTKKKFKKKMKQQNLLFKEKIINHLDYISVRNSYRGHLSYGNCNGLYKSYVDYLSE